MASTTRRNDANLAAEAAAPAIDGEEMKKRIVAAAAEAFMAHGYEATSINLISRELKATKGLIYHHYDSKAELFYAVHETAMRMNLAVIEPIATSAASPTARLQAMLEEQLFLIIERYPFMCVVRQGVESSRIDSISFDRARLQQLIAMRNEYERHFLDVVRAGLDAGEFHAYDADMATKSLLGVVNWLTVWYRPRSDETAASRKRIVQGTIDFIMSSLRPVA